MLQGTQSEKVEQFSTGLVTYPNFYILKAGQSPRCMDVRWDVGGSIAKRLGSIVLNSTALVSQATVTGFSPDSGGTLAVALTSYWKLDEGGGSRADSIDGNGLTDHNSTGSDTGKVSAAASFIAANSNYLSVPHNPTLGPGDANFTISGWFRLASTGILTVAGKRSSTSGQFEYWLHTTTANRLLWEVSSSNFAWNGSVLATSFGALSTATFYSFAAWHDASNNKIGVSVNLSVTTGSYTSAIRATSSPFTIGGITDGTVKGFDPDNGDDTAAAMQAYWNLDEASGSRLDQVTINHLADNNSVVGTAGIVNTGALFVAANSQFLSITSCDALRSGNRDWSLAGWFRVNDTTNTYSLVGKIPADAGNLVDKEYFLYFEPADKRIHVAVWRNTADLNTDFANVTTINQNTWYFAVAWRNTSSGMMFLQINNATINSAAITGSNTGNATFTLGATREGTVLYLDGAMDEWGFWAKIISTNDRTGLYNSGVGNTYVNRVGLYMNGRVDEVAFHGKVLTAQERSDLHNAGNGNSYNSATSRSGWGMFDFGATNIRWLTVAAGTGIYASSNRGVTFVSIATDRTSAYQSFERSKNVLIATSDSQQRVLYWAGSVGTFMLGMPLGSAPAAKYALDYQGFLFLMNDSGGKRRISYADNNIIPTSPWTSNFEIPSSADDEITGGVVLNRKAYISTKYLISKVSFVGGNPDFSEQTVKNFGFVPHTIKKVTYTDKGEVIIGLCWDKNVRIFDGAEELIISDAIQQNNNQSQVFLAGLSEDNITKCHAELDTLKQEYNLWIVMSPSSETTHRLCLNLRTGSWYPYLDRDGINAAVMADSANNRAMVGISRIGYVHHINTGNTDNGTAIDEYLESHFFTAEDPREVKKSHSMTLSFTPTSSGTIHYQDRTAFNRSFGPVRDKVPLTGAGTSLQTVKSIDVPLTQGVYQFKINSSASTANPWELNRTEFDSSLHGKGKAG